MKKLLLFGALAFGLSAFGQLPAYVPPADLGGWWSFSGNYNDQSTFANNGTNNGSSFTNDRFSNANSAIYCDGSGQHVAIPHPSNSSLDPGSGSFTVAGWIRSSNSSSANPIVEKKNFNGYALFMSIAGEMKFRIEDMNSNLIDAISPISSYNDGQWHHAVGVRDVSVDSLFLWVDGILVKTNLDSTVSNVECTEPFYIGEWGGTPNDMNGDLDDIGYWNRALSPCEIQDLYNAGLNSVVNSVTQTGPLLTSDQNGAIYQWIDCDNGNAPLSMETNQSFTPSVTGNYAVEVNMNGCFVTSTCYLVDYTGIEELLQTEKELVKIVDFMGRETEFKPNTPLIYIYSDGTRERVMKLEE